MNAFNRYSLFLTLLAILLISLASHAATPQILLVGDSWAALEGVLRSFESAFDAAGKTEWTARGYVTGRSGSTAAQWTSPIYLQLITDELAANPSITIVHISLGGNDFLGYVNGTRTRQELDAFYQNIVANIAVVVDHALSQRPNIRVGVCSYDYLIRTQSGMTIPQVNAELLIFGQVLREYADSKGRCVYLNNWGLMQHTFGIDNVYAPGELPAPGGPPDYIPFAGGDVTRPGVALGDLIHLNAAGYEVLAKNCLEQAYLPWLDVDPPTVLGIAAITSPANAPVLAYRVTFSEPVIGVDLSDFLIETTGAIRDERFVVLHGGGDTYTVFVERGFGSGTLTLSLVNDGSIRGILPLNVNAVVGDTYTITEDRELPVVAWPAALLVVLAGAARLARRGRRALTPAN